MTALKAYRMALALFAISSFLIALLSLYVHTAFLVLFFANVFFWSWRAKSVRCSNCGCPVAPSIGASALSIVKSFSNRACRNCGSQLD